MWHPLKLKTNFVILSLPIFISGRVVGLLVGFLTTLFLTVLPLHAQSNGKSKNPVYTVSNFEVWAEAKDAVAAKRAALADGKAIAFSLLLKRLTLYSSYKHHPKLAVGDVSKLITSLSVQNERNSATEYLANMDFKFSEKRVKALMRQNNLAYWDRQAPELIVVPVVDAGLLEVSAGQKKPLLSQADWVSSWNTLDLSHSLVPLKLGERLALIDDAVLSALIQGDARAKAGLSKAYKGKLVVIALISASNSKNKLRLNVFGLDSIGEIAYKRDHVISEGSYIEAADLAAEVVVGMFEQRLKMLRVRPQVAMRKPPAEVLPWQTNTQEDAPVVGWQGDVGGARILMHVKFNGLRHWQSIRKRLIGINGVEELNIEKLSARGADVSCLFPGGADAFASQVASLGMRLQPDGDKWVLLTN